MLSNSYTRRAVVAGLLSTTMLIAPFRTQASAQGAGRKKSLSVAREESGSYTLAMPGSPDVRVTFLDSTAVRIHVPKPDPKELQLSEYVRVKMEYPVIDVSADVEGDKVTFRTSSAILNLSLRDQVLLGELRTPDKVLIGGCQIDVGERLARIELQRGERIYGFGDKRAALNQRGRKVDILNRDAFASETNESYKSIPFYMSSAGYGLFFHNYRPSNFDIGASEKNQLRIKVSGGEMDFYLFIGNMKEILSQYTELTGRPAMLPYWAFGYHQAKATYRGREGMDVAARMRQRRLPFDVIYYDAFDQEAVSKPFIDELWSRYRARLTVGFGMPMFGTWRGNDDAELLGDLASLGYLMVDRNNRPAIGRDEHVEEDGDRSSVAYLDYFSVDAVEHIFTEKWEDAINNGAILGMVDFGELDHMRNAEQKFWPSLGLSVAQTRNLFGLVYPMAVVNGVLDRIGGRSTGMVRPGFAGSQRLGWTTTGDSLPTYRNFRAHTRGMLNLTLSGFSNVGQDIGGWDSKAGRTLYARWFAAATFFPFMWAHGKDDHEPYSHGEVVESAARTLLELRYRLIPYLYSLHEEAHRTGVPVLRTLVLQEPADPAGFRIDDQFFVGDDILVAPLFDDDNRKLYLPKGLWYDFFAEHRPVIGGHTIAAKSVPLHRLPAYVRAGAVVPLGPVMQHTGEVPVDPLTVNIYSFAGSDLAAVARTSAFALYEDDGSSTDYLEGAFQRTHLRFHQTREELKFEIAPESGDRDYKAVSRRGYRLLFQGVQGSVSDVRVDGIKTARGTASDSASSGLPTWTNNEWSGDISVFIPSSAVRPLTAEIKILPA